jgi:hypothetical protein
MVAVDWRRTIPFNPIQNQSGCGLD